MNKKQLDLQQALSLYTSLCSRSEYCEFDIRRKMANTTLDENEQNHIIDYLKQERYIDNKRFAEAFVRDKARFNGWGPQKIRFELSLRHIDTEIISIALQQVENNDFNDQLIHLLKSKLRTSTQSDPLRLKASLIRFAASRGFSYDQISEALSQLLTDNDD